MRSSLRNILEKVAVQVDKRSETWLAFSGVWGGKGQGKSFQTELIFKALDIEPIIMSAGEMESEWAGLPSFSFWNCM
jgi:hypothetical protein